MIHRWFVRLTIVVDVVAPVRIVCNAVGLEEKYNSQRGIFD